MWNACLVQRSVAPPPIEFAACDPTVLARGDFTLVRGRALRLGFVDLDAHDP